MKPGTTTALKIDIPGLDVGTVDEIIFTFKRYAGEQWPILLQKSFPDDTKYIDGFVYLPLSQEETLSFPMGNIHIEGQINYINQGVNKTVIRTIQVSNTMYTQQVESTYLGLEETVEMEMNITPTVLIETPVQVGVSQKYVDEQDQATLEQAKGYVDTKAFYTQGNAISIDESGKINVVETEIHLNSLANRDLPNLWTVNQTQGLLQFQTETGQAISALEIFKASKNEIPKTANDITTAINGETIPQQYFNETLTQSLEIILRQYLNEAKAYTDVQLKTLTPTELFFRPDGNMPPTKPVGTGTSVNYNLTTTEQLLFTQTFTVDEPGVLKANNVYDLRIALNGVATNKDTTLRVKYTLNDKRVFEFIKVLDRISTQDFIKTILNELDYDISYQSAALKVAVYGRVSTGSSLMSVIYQDVDRASSLTRNLVN